MKMRHLGKRLATTMILLVVMCFSSVGQAAESISASDCFFANITDTTAALQGIRGAVSDTRTKLELPSKLINGNRTSSIVRLDYNYNVLCNMKDYPNLKEVVIPSTVTMVGSQYFQSSEKLEKVTIPSSVTALNEGAFNNCQLLNTISGASSVRTIGSSAFRKCYSLTSFNLTTNLTSLGASAFYASGLTSITIPSSLSTLKNYTFASCSNLRTVTIPKSIKTIEPNCFYGCPDITVYYAGSSADWAEISIGSGNTALKDIKYGESPPAADTISSFTATATTYVNNAYLKATATATGNGNWTQSGIRVYKGSTLVASKDEYHNYSRSSLDIWYDVNAELGVTLSENTQYNYYFYTYFNGTRYTTPTQYFTTKVNPNLTFTNTLEAVGENYFTFSFRADANTRGIYSEFGCTFRNETANYVISNYSNTTDSNLNVPNAQFFSINSWTPYSNLSPNTTYSYQVYYVFNGTRFVSQVYTVKTNDWTGPTLSTPTISNITKDGYDITVEARDGGQIARVQFPTWTEPGGQDDLRGDWQSSTACSGVLTNYTSSGTHVKATYHVSVGDHGYQRNCNYITHVYAYDRCGNSTVVQASAVYVDGTSPSFSSCYVGWSVKNKTLSIESLATDASGIDSYQAAVWMDGDSESSAVVQRSTSSSFTYDISRFGQLSTTTYHIKVYAQDKMGNVSAFGSVFSVTSDYDPPEFSRLDTGNPDPFHIDLTAYLTAVEQMAPNGTGYFRIWPMYDGKNASDGYIEMQAFLGFSTGSQTYFPLTNPLIYKSGTGIARTYKVSFYCVDGAGNESVMSPEITYTVPAKTSSYQSLVLPKQVKSIGEEAFTGDRSIQYVMIPEGCKTIGKRAFANTSIRCIGIPNSVTYIAEDAFENASVDLILCSYANATATNLANSNGIRVEYWGQ